MPSDRTPSSEAEASCRTDHVPPSARSLDALDRLLQLALDVCDASLACLHTLPLHASAPQAAQGNTDHLPWVHQLLARHEALPDAPLADTQTVHNGPSDAPATVRHCLGLPFHTSSGGGILSIVTATRPSERTHSRLRDLADISASLLAPTSADADAASPHAAAAPIPQNITEGIYRSRPDGTILYANAAMAALFGYDAPHAFQRITADALYATPADRHVLQTRLQHASTVEGFEVKFRRADGTTFWGRLSTTAVRDDSGAIRYYDGVLTNITAEKEARDALRQTAERWERLVDTHPDPIHVSTDGIIQYVNPAGVAVYGASSADEIIGRPIDAFMVHADDTAATHERAARLYDAGEPTPPREFTIERLDGKQRIVEVRSVPIEYKGKPSAQTIVRDVTAQRRLEEQLHVRQQRLRKLLDHAQPIVFVIDNDGTFLVSEGRDLQALGLRPGEVVGQSVYDLFADAPSVLGDIERALAGHTISGLVELDDRVLDVWYAPIYAPDRAIIGCIGMAVDITERRAAEDALRTERDVLASIFNTSPAAILVLDADGRITKANARAAALLREPVADLIGRTYTDLAGRFEDISGGVLSTAHHPFTQALTASEPIYELESIIQWPNHPRRIVSINAAPLRSAQETAGAVLVLNDVTAQREQDARLRQSRMRYQALVNHFPGGVFLFNEDLEYVLAGGAGIEALGMSPEDFHGRTPSDLFPPPIANETEQYYRRALRGQAGTFKQNYQGATYRIQTVPLQLPDGLVYAGMAVSQNITEAARAEAMLRTAKQKAEEAARLKSSMLANMSHEVRTPLTAIIGFAEVLTEETDALPQHFASLILRSGRRLLTTLDSVLHLSQLEAGTQGLHYEPVNLSKLARHLIAEESIQARQHAITLELESTDAPIVLSTDRGAVQRILSNVLSNALKYTEANGRVMVRMADGARGVLIEVEDTGIGMTRAFQARMFDAFTQESDGLDRTHEGSGLGLAIVQKLVAMLDGSIEVESSPGMGTRFAIFLPRPA